jgi:hypothetical protein
LDYGWQSCEAAAAAETFSQALETVVEFEGLAAEVLINQTNSESSAAVASFENTLDLAVIWLLSLIKTRKL